MARTIVIEGGVRTVLTFNRRSDYINFPFSFESETYCVRCRAYLLIFPPTPALSFRSSTQVFLPVKSPSGSDWARLRYRSRL